MIDINISVIVPIYNTGEYLSECLTSIMKQDFCNYELICVDDNSSDVITKKILSEYEDKFKKHDKNIRVVYSKEKLGAAECRNLGFRLAKGKYVIFLDSDDYFDKSLLRRLYDGINRSNADVVMCGYYINNTIVSFPNNFELMPKEKQFKYSMLVPWNKLCKREYILKNDIMFKTYTSSNDVYYSCMVVLCSDNVSIVNLPMIKHRVGHSTQISYSRNPNNVILAFNDVYDVVNNSINIQLNTLSILRKIFNYTINEIRYSCRDEMLKRNAYYNLRSYVEKHIDEYKEIISLLEIDNLCTKPYESNWFISYDPYYLQLESKTSNIISAIDNNEIILCGMGERGKAFIKWAKKHNIAVFGMCDKKNDRCGELIDGIMVYSREEALKKDVLYIASNQVVYDELITITDKTIINMEEYSL